MNTIVRFLTVLTIIVILVMAWGFFGIVNAFALGGDSLLPGRPAIDAHFPRWDACRTYDIGGFDPTDGVSCGNEEPATKKDQTEDTSPIVELPALTVEPVVTTVEPVTVPDVVEAPETVEPDVAPEPTQERERGNPGNDKPVGNAGEKCDMGGFCENGNHGNRGRSN